MPVAVAVGPGGVPELPEVCVFFLVDLHALLPGPQEWPELFKQQVAWKQQKVAYDDSLKKKVLAVCGMLGLWGRGGGKAEGMGGEAVRASD